MPNLRFQSIAKDACWLSISNLLPITAMLLLTCAAVALLSVLLRFVIHPTYLHQSANVTLVYLALIYMVAAPFYTGALLQTLRSARQQPSSWLTCFIYFKQWHRLLPFAIAMAVLDGLPTLSHSWLWRHASHDWHLHWYILFSQFSSYALAYAVGGLLVLALALLAERRLDLQQALSQSYCLIKPYRWRVIMLLIGAGFLTLLPAHLLLLTTAMPSSSFWFSIKLVILLVFGAWLKLFHFTLVVQLIANLQQYQPSGESKSIMRAKQWESSHGRTDTQSHFFS